MPGSAYNVAMFRTITNARRIWPPFPGMVTVPYRFVKLRRVICWRIVVVSRIELYREDVGYSWSLTTRHGTLRATIDFSNSNTESRMRHLITWG